MYLGLGGRGEYGEHNEVDSIHQLSLRMAGGEWLCELGGGD
jgi:hypothetical protein